MTAELFERFAIYCAPEMDEPLSVFGRTWLGIYSASGKLVAHQTHGLELTMVRRITAEARRYGFHGTLKAPLKLAAEKKLAGLFAQLEALCRIQPP